MTVADDKLAGLGGPTYDALDRLLDTLKPDYVEASAIQTARQWARFFEASGTPCPTVWWHGGDAVVFNFGKGDGEWLLTITDSGVGLLDPSNRRTVSEALSHKEPGK